MDGINFVWTLSIGHVINLVALLCAGMGSFFLLKYHVKAVEVKIIGIESSLTKFDMALVRQTEILVSVARQDEQIKSLTEQFRDMRLHRPIQQ